MRLLILAAALLVAAPALADAPPAQPTAPAGLKQQVEAILAMAPQGTRWGVLVTDASGREVVSIDPDKRFIPASNTKLFTTAVALWKLPYGVPGTRVRLDPGAKGRQDVVLIGRGDPRLSSAPDCKDNCLSVLADAVAKEARSVRNVIGDATLFPDQRWSPGMSWNNIGTDSGTAISALSLDDNELPIVVAPTKPGQPPVITVSPYLTLINEAETVAAGPRALNFEIKVNSRVLRVYGRIPVGDPYRDRLGIDDPAHYAAWTFKRMLAERGVRVRGEAISRYRPVGIDDGPEQRLPVLATVHPDDLAAIIPTSLLEDITIINKVSQNLHSEILLRRVGLESGDGSLRNGAAAIQTMLAAIGIPRAGYDFADGSGMSTYNRISPRAAVALLRWTQSQPWAAEYRASLPIGGVDGTLRRRFAGTPLAGKIFAKTGTLNATNALSGWMIGASGRELTFSIIANDVPDGTSVLATMDSVLVEIAAQN
ncbi:MAG: D-alanyl-D-alanine carboxypeptidase/D-alanyl-D-alanine-endopeptidase [Pseudomonadota bacterium]|nr:D-alanyl-D-alanine carboxypeptidase/D-alanyl-D-alanine-endopeptidase [Pseudomonadota bacterium]